MATVYLSVRVIHVLLGVYWAGSVFLAALFLNPSVVEAGAEGGKVMGIMQRRGYTRFVFSVGVGTLLTGFYLLWSLSGHFSPGFMGSRSGILLSVGMLAGLAALGVGVMGTLPAGRKMGAIQATVAAGGGPPSPEEMAEMMRYRDRIVSLVKVLGVLLLVAVVTMGLGPHV
jgi:uncharacterized membrane protein